MRSDIVYLTQTDTTVGFLSQNRDRLFAIKERDRDKPFLIVVDSFKTLQNFVRVPERFKKLVRDSKEVTFIYPNSLAIRVVKNQRHRDFLKRFKWSFSTSANLSGSGFDIEFAKESCDIIVFDIDEFSERSSSKIFKLSKFKLKRLR